MNFIFSSIYLKHYLRFQINLFKLCPDKLASIFQAFFSCLICGRIYVDSKLKSSTFVLLFYIKKIQIIEVAEMKKPV